MSKIIGCAHVCECRVWEGEMLGGAGGENEKQFLNLVSVHCVVVLNFNTLRINEEML